MRCWAFHRSFGCSCRSTFTFHFDSNPSGCGASSGGVSAWVVRANSCELSRFFRLAVYYQVLGTDHFEYFILGSASNTDGISRENGMHEQCFPTFHRINQDNLVNTDLKSSIYQRFQQQFCRYQRASKNIGSIASLINHAWR